MAHRPTAVGAQALAGALFFFYGAGHVMRLSELSGWYPWAVVACLLGGLFLLITLLPAADSSLLRLSGRGLILLGSASPLDALAFFLIMRIPLAWWEWLEFTLPPGALLLLFLEPPVYRVFRRQSP